MTSAQQGHCAADTHVLCACHAVSGSGAWTCQENGFDKSKCPGAGVQTVFVALGEKCGYTQDNKQYACGKSLLSGSNLSHTSTTCPATRIMVTKSLCHGD